MKTTDLFCFVALVLIASLCCGVVLAEEKAAPPAWQPGKTLYVPYDPKKPELPKAIDRVYLPYDDFLDLWDRAYPDHKAPEKKPIVAYAISNAAYRGRVEGDQAVFDAKLEIETLANEWTEVPIALLGVAIREAKVNDQPATLSARDSGYSLGFDKAGRRALAISFAVPLRTASGSGSFQFTAPPIPTSMLSFVLPSADLQAEVTPCLGGQRIAVANGKTLLEADIGGVAQVTVSWSPKAAASADGIPAHVEAVNQQALIFQEGYLEAHSRMTFTISRKPVSEMAARVAKPLVVYSITGDKLKGWLTRPEEPEVVRIAFATPVIGSARVEIHAGARMSGDGAPSAIPLINAHGVATESGTLEVRSSTNLKCEVIPSSGMERVNLTRETWSSAAASLGAEAVAAYVYARGPVSLQAKVQPLRPTLTSQIESLATIEREEMHVLSRVDVEVKGGEVYEAGIDVPASWKVTDVAEESLQDWWSETKDGWQRVHVTFTNPIQRGRSVVVTCSTSVTDSGSIALVSPRLADAAEQRGSICLAVPQGFALTTQSVRNFRPLDVAKAAIKCTVPESFKPAMAYSFVELDHALTVTLKSIAPAVTAVAVTTATIESGVLRALTTLRYEVRDAAEDTFSFSLPASVGNQIEMKSAEIRQVNSEVAGEGEAARRVWKIKLHAPRTGTVEHSFALELGLPEKEDIRIPRLEIRDVARSQHYVVLANRSEYVVEAKSLKDIQEIPPSEVPFLPTGAAAGSAVTAYKARSDEWGLTFSKELTHIQQLVEAVIDWAEIKSSLTKDGRMLSQVIYHIQNRTEQYLEVEMPHGAEIWSVFVRKEPVRPAVIARGARTNTLIPLVKTTAGDLSFDVEIVYSQALPEAFGRCGSEDLAGPKVVRVPVTQTYWSLYLPEDYRYYWFRGNMDEIVEEVKLVDKAKGWAKEQAQILQTLQQGTEAQKQKARMNWNYLEERLKSSLEEAQAKNAMKQQQAQQGKLRGSKEGKLAQQYISNEANLQVIQQQVESQEAQQQDIEKEIAEQKPAAPPASQPMPQKGAEKEMKKEVKRDFSVKDELGAMHEFTRTDMPQIAPAVTKAGILSIRVDIPETGEAFHFKKLQSDARLTFQHASKKFTNRFGLAVVLLLVVFATFGARRLVRRP